MNSLPTRTLEIPSDLAGLRFDQAMSALFPEYSRSRLQDWIRKGNLTINGVQQSSKNRVIGGEKVTLNAEIEEPSSHPEPEAIPLSITYEDEDLLIVDKPSGLVVHPAAGNWTGTLQNALIHHCKDLAKIPRCGIVHRIDKDTTGLLMIAKTLEAHHSLVQQLQERTVNRGYIALVQGAMTGGGTIDAPIGRHPTDRKRFAVQSGGKLAVTHFRLAERFSKHTLIHVKLETGRTHQIRVHMSHINYPLVGDPVYGGRPRLPAGASDKLTKMLQTFGRQALHAEKLGIVHPITGHYQEWAAALPQDFSCLIDELRTAN